MTSGDGLPTIKTISGVRWDLVSPQADQVSLDDIAHALARQCRFNGHVAATYSVAQHAVIVALEVWRRTRKPELALWGLHHDDEEAYLGDIVAPLKRWVQRGLGDAERAQLSIVLNGLDESGKLYLSIAALVESLLDRYTQVAKRTQRVICEHFGLPPEEPEIVKRVDKALLRVEQHHLQPPFIDGSDSDRHATKPADVAHITLAPHEAGTVSPAHCPGLFVAAADRNERGQPRRLWLPCWSDSAAEAEFLAAHAFLAEQLGS